jgi:hypothetical protein
MASFPGAALADGSAPGYPGSTLHVSINGSLVARHVLTIVATGQNAPDSLQVRITRNAAKHPHRRRPPHRRP